MAGNLSKSLCTAIVLSVAVVVLAAGCNHSRSTPESAPAVPDEVSQISPALIGKQITIRGKFSLWGKVGPYIVLDNQQVVYVEATKGSFTWGKPYSEMEGKVVTATGILRFYHSPDATPTKRSVTRLPDYFYFEVETTQVQTISH